MIYHLNYRILMDTFNDEIQFYVTEKGGAILDMIKKKSPNVVAVKPSWISEINSKQKLTSTTSHLVNWREAELKRKKKKKKEDAFENWKMAIVRWKWCHEWIIRVRIVFEWFVFLPSEIPLFLFSGGTEPYIFWFLFI